MQFLSETVSSALFFSVKRTEWNETGKTARLQALEYLGSGCSGGRGTVGCFIAAVSQRSAGFFCLSCIYELDFRTRRNSETLSMCVRWTAGCATFASTADGAMRDTMDGSDGR